MAQMEVFDYMTRASKDEDAGTVWQRDEEWWFDKAAVMQREKEEANRVAIPA